MAKLISFGTVGFGVSAILCVLAACGGAKGGSDDDEADTGGTSGSSSTGGSNTGGTNTGGTNATGGAPSCMPNPTPQSCSGAPVNMHMPVDGLLINWDTYMVGSGNWGNPAVGDLTGGTSKYNGKMVDPIAVAIDADKNLHITATVPPYTPNVADDAENYAGLVFWFGPCIDASDFGGVSFTVGGTMNGAVLRLQVQTSENYPADPANSKGECSFTNCDTRYSECKGPDTAVTVPATPGEVSLMWSAFAGGSPNATVNNTGLVGLQYQLECQSMDAACAVDITLGDISLIAN